MNPQSKEDLWNDGELEQSLDSSPSISTKSNYQFSQIVNTKQKKFFVFAFEADLQDAKETNQGLSSPHLLVGILKAEIFSDLLSDYKEALNDAFVVDDMGRVYAHPSLSFIGSQFSNHPVVADLMSSQKNSGTGDQYTDAKNEEIVASYLRIPKSNLFVVVSTPKKEAFSAANELFLNLLIIGIGVGLIAFVLSLFFARKITKPLGQLKEAAEIIGNGDFKVDFQLNSNDEVGDLSASIRRMAKNLIERDEALDASKNALVQSEKMSAFGQISAGIAHEVKNPLAGILGHAQLAKGKTTDPDLQKHISFIEKETRRTKEIIEGLMKFSRSEKLELAPTNLFDAVHGAVDFVDHQLSLMGVQISRHIQKVGPVLGQTNQIQQVLLNLMMNAGHAMEKSEIKKLDVYLEEKDGHAQVRITDSGSGMPPEVKKRIFEPFFTTKPAGKGTGLGLSVSVGIVQDHKAKINVESEVGVGTTFIIDFPLNYSIELPASEREEDDILSPTGETADQALANAEKVLVNLAEIPKSHAASELLNVEVPQDKVDQMADALFDEDLDTLGGKTMLSSDLNLPPIPPEAKNTFDMHSSRDYLNQNSENKTAMGPRHSYENKAEVKNDTTNPDFKVSIRKPKTNKG